MTNWPPPHHTKKMRAAEIAAALARLTPEQRRDVKTMVDLGGFKISEALATVTRPKIKVRAPSSVPSALPRSGA